MIEDRTLTIENVDQQWVNELRMIVTEARQLLPRLSALAEQVESLETRFNREHEDVIADEYPEYAIPMDARDVLAALAEPLKDPAGVADIDDPEQLLEVLADRIEGKVLA